MSDLILLNNRWLLTVVTSYTEKFWKEKSKKAETDRSIIKHQEIQVRNPKLDSTHARCYFII